MLRAEIEDKITELLGAKDLYVCDTDSLNDTRIGLNSTDSPDDAFEQCIDEFDPAELELDKLIDWITDNFEEKSDAN